MDVAFDAEPGASYQTAASPKYFGHNPGYFSFAGNSVVVQLWNPRFGVVVGVANVERVADAFSVQLEATDVEHALGRNAQVQAHITSHRALSQPPPLFAPPPH